MRQVARLHSAIAERLQFARAFHSRPFTLLWAGQTISVLGDAVFTIAITWEVLLLTDSATAMSLILIAQWAPRILFLLLGGVIADRVSRRFLMLCADVGRGCIVMLVAWLSWTHLLQFWHLVALAPLFGIVSSFFDPAYQAIMPQLVETEALTSVNSLNTLSRNVGFLLGPVPGAICAALFGMASAFAFDGLTYGISALCLLALRLPASTAPSQVEVPAHPAEADEARNHASQGIRGAMRDARDGLRYVSLVKHDYVPHPLRQDELELPLVRVLWMQEGEAPGDRVPKYHRSTRRRRKRLPYRKVRHKLRPARVRAENLHSGSAY